MNFSDYLKLYEEIESDKTPYRCDLPFSLDATAPAMSESVNYIHYDILHANYVSKWEKKPSDFTWYGAMLHNLWWQNLKPYSKDSGWTEIGPAGDMLKGMFGSGQKMLDTFVEEANKLQGNGWLVLTKKGKLLTIPNHSAENVFDDIVLLLDLWEHASVGHCFQREPYLIELVNCINWTTVSERLDR